MSNDAPPPKRQRKAGSGAQKDAGAEAGERPTSIIAQFRTMEVRPAAHARSCGPARRPGANFPTPCPQICVSAQDEDTGPQLELPLSATPEQMELIVNKLLTNEDRRPFAFYVDTHEVADTLDGIVASQVSPGPRATAGLLAAAHRRPAPPRAGNFHGAHPHHQVPTAVHVSGPPRHPLHGFHARSAARAAPPPPPPPPF